MEYFGKNVLSFGGILATGGTAVTLGSCWRDCEQARR